MIAHCVLPNYNLKLFKLVGAVEVKEVLAFIKGRAAAGDREVMPSLWVDLREVATVMSYEEVSQIIAGLQLSEVVNREHRVGFLVASKAVFGVCRMFGMLLTSRLEVEVQVFLSIEAGEKWLGVPLRELLAELPPERWETA
ncbi:hypothetical protein [Actomonas aquatica]|uniref:STAS/SEC14 domain-containing protein n=1 Tax=Actomonas aquatica TaxID=2866162 RepID=A0ABZ1C4M0_9BACT|nr:hypothetical protein [Opitutus sp. WL0086]WRQ86327.1 hypothetical protein K1X11_016040 [Opitutus sp. WL0086]